MRGFILLTFVLATVSAETFQKAVHPKDFIPPPQLQGRITNGQTAEEEQFPFACALLFSGPLGRWFCTGSIIDKNWVMTAAHCTNEASNVTISCGSVNRLTPTQTFNVNSCDFEQHPNYNENNLRNDISLIKTPTFEFSSTIKAVNLPERSCRCNTFAGVTGVVCGWGKTSDASNTAVENLQWVDLEIMENSVCTQTYGPFIVARSTVCAATPNKQSTCNGDSGGPLSVREDGYYTQVGITSFVSSLGCESGTPAGFVRVTSFLDWIADKTGLDC